MRISKITAINIVILATSACQKEPPKRHHQYLYLSDGGRIPLKNVNLTTFAAPDEDAPDGGTRDEDLPDAGDFDEQTADAQTEEGRH